MTDKDAHPRAPASPAIPLPGDARGPAPVPHVATTLGPQLCGGPGPPGKEGHGAQAAWQPTRSGPRATRGPLRPAPVRGRACPFPGTPAELACPQPELEQEPGTRNAGQLDGSAFASVRGGPPENTCCGNRGALGGCSPLRTQSPSFWEGTRGPTPPSRAPRAGPGSERAFTPQCQTV